MFFVLINQKKTAKKSNAGINGFQAFSITTFKLGVLTSPKICKASLISLSVTFVWSAPNSTLRIALTNKVKKPLFIYFMIEVGVTPIDLQTLKM